MTTTDKNQIAALANIKISPDDIGKIQAFFTNFKITKKIDFLPDYMLIFRNLKQLKDITPVLKIMNSFFTDDFDVYNFTSLESFVTFWNNIQFNISVMYQMTAYYQNIMTSQDEKYKKSSDFATELLHKKFNDIKDSFCTKLVALIISEFNHTPVDKALVKKSINIIKSTNSFDYFRQQYTSICTGHLSGKEYDLTSAVNIYLHITSCADDYDIQDITIPILQTTICIPTVADHSAQVDIMLRDVNQKLTQYYKLTKYISEEALNEFGKMISQHIITNCKDVEKVEVAIERNQKYMKILDLLELGRFDKKGISTFFYCGFQQVFESFSETLALFIDSAFQKKLSEDEFEALMYECVSLVNYIKDKDVFFTYYKKLFSRRLITMKKVTLERVVLICLKKQFSAAYTHNLEKMFKDIESADEINQEFRQTATSCLNMTVLTQGCWPNFSLATIPASMQSQIDEFQKFYKTKFSGRNLKILSIGTCEIKMGKFVLHTNVAQMNVLLAINETSDFDEICKITQLGSDVVQGVLASLMLAKHPVVIKKNDGYIMNSNFKSKTISVKITQNSKKETAVEKKETMKQVEDERNMKIDAVIVRHMKARKESDYNTIVIETTKALQNFFNPNPQMIKKRIETLIEREYMCRSEDDNKMFIYVA